MSLLEVKNLVVVDNKSKQSLVENINFKLDKNMCLGIVGESGSGKSITAKAILGLLSCNLKTNGSIIFNDDIELLKIKKNELRKIRGQKICMILQDAMSSFDPLYTIGYQMVETLVENKGITKNRAKDISIEYLEKMNISNTRDVIKKYPHQLSGGMLQRCMIALALSMKPDIIIADEPTTALDSINQKEVVEQLKKIRELTGTSLIFISHDLGIVKYLAQDVLVMKDGKQVEYAKSSEVFNNPKHEYTKYLINTRLDITNSFNMYVNKEVAV